MADQMQWEMFESHWFSLYGSKGGQRASSGRRVAGLLMLKHMESVSDERLMQVWVTNPYYQYFCGETHFQHRPPADPTSLIKWRKRLIAQAKDQKTKNKLYSLHEPNVDCISKGKPRKRLRWSYSGRHAATDGDVNRGGRENSGRGFRLPRQAQHKRRCDPPRQKAK